MLLTILLLPFFGSLIAAFLPANARNREAWLAAGISLAGLLISVWLFFQMEQSTLYYRVSWLPEYGLELVLRMDGLAWLFAVLVQGIGLLVVLYARYYMSAEDPVPRFFSFLLSFMGAMLGVVLSGNLIQLVVFWELTSLTSFLLIGYWHHRIDARLGARMAFTVTAAGGLCLLAGVLLLGHIVGSYDLDAVLAAGDQIRASDLYLPALILVALGALTKSAQFPFHFWLPHAMAAPTPVSAYLHSATMVKAGIFLLMRLWPSLSGTPEWNWIIGGAGLCTMLLGSFIAIFQHDLKGLLAYSTIAHLGLITLLLGMGTPLAMVAAIFHVLNHAIFKASLFMAVGIIDHESGTRDLRVLSGLYRSIPITATLAIVASASMAGVPLLNGFISKEMFFAETLMVNADGKSWVSLAAVVMGIFSVAYSLRFISVFFGPQATDLPKQPHEPPHWMRFPVELLVLLCLLVGIAPAFSAGPLLASAVSAVLGEHTPQYSLALWHGFNLPMLMSLAALAGGVTLYILLRRYYGPTGSDRVPLLPRIYGANIYDRCMLYLSVQARLLIRYLGTARLQPQLFIIILALVLVSLSVLQLPIPRSLTPSFAPDRANDMLWLFAALWVIGSLCALMAAWQAKYHRLTALVLVSGTGLVTCMTFMWLSAPDLALTQLMVETVTTVLILLGLRWLPARIPRKQMDLARPASVWPHRIRDLLIATAGGGIMMALSYAVLMREAPLGIADFFLQKAAPEGGGTNVVNVILVDFRALDTLGEITVLAIVALTVYALLRRFRPAPESAQIPAQQLNPVDPHGGHTPEQLASHGFLAIPAIFLRLLLPFFALVAVYFFMRGHNLPGGGFVAGLIFATALIVQYILAGTQWVEARFRLQSYKWIVWGLGLAMFTGLGALLMGYPFLTSHTAHTHIPILGTLHLPSAFVFDLGVFAAVVGATMLILIALSHQSMRSHRLPVAAAFPEADSATNPEPSINSDNLGGSR